MICQRSRFVVLAVFPPCASRAPGPRRACFVHGSHRSGSGHSPRSLFRAAFRYPLDQTLSRPGRASERDSATLMGFLALRSVPWPRVPAFLRFIPTCRWLNRSRALPADFYGLPIARAHRFELLPSESQIGAWTIDVADDPLGFWVMLPRTS